jgi:hypothetical protein
MQSIAYILESLATLTERRQRPTLSYKDLDTYMDKWASSHGVAWIPTGYPSSIEVNGTLLETKYAYPERDATDGKKLPSVRKALPSLRKFLRPLGWTPAFVQLMHDFSGMPGLVVQLQPLHGVARKPPRMLYHVVGKRHIKDILARGLRPRAQSGRTFKKGYANPKRVYLFTDKRSALWWANRWMKDGAKSSLVLLRIDTGKLSSSTKFYIDPNMPMVGGSGRLSSLWTTGTIPARAIHYQHGRVFVRLIGSIIGKSPG